MANRQEIVREIDKLNKSVEDAEFEKRRGTFGIRNIYI